MWTLILIEIIPEKIFVIWNCMGKLVRDSSGNQITLFLLVACFFLPLAMG